MAAFQIPAEYADRLEVMADVDPRSDDEILQTLLASPPVTSEKNIWAYWHAGVGQMPAWCQRNAIDWVRICGPQWTVRVLDPLPSSPNYVFKFLPADVLPEAFVKGTMDGDFPRQHSADMVRGAALYTHGGAWMDVGSALTRHLDDVCWSKLADPASPYQMAVMHEFGAMTVNFFVAARKGDPFIKRWHDLFAHLWEGRTNHEGLMASPLMAFALTLSYEDAEEAGMKIAWKVPELTVLDYVAQCMCMMRVAMLEDMGDGFSGVDHWTTKTVLLNCLHEGYPAEAQLGFDGGGQPILDALTTRLDSDRGSEQYRRAERVVWGALADSCMMKAMHGGGDKLMAFVQLGTLLDMPENEGKDRAPGTFGELLRYGAVHFRQKRKEPMINPTPTLPLTLRKGLYEP